LREKYCWLVAGGWFVLREKYCWLVADKPNEQGGKFVADNWPPTEGDDESTTTSSFGKGG
jgi:hypothetical protein